MDTLELPAKTVEWSDLEKLAWVPPENLTVSEWADRHRVLHALTSSEPGPWRTTRVPYLKGVMDAFGDPKIERITFLAATQVGKTSFIENALGYQADQDPGPALLVMPREEDAISIGQRRIRPMLEGSPQLSRHLSDSKTDNKMKEIRLKRSMVHFAGANSPADLASRAVRYLFCDEVDKYPLFSGREADPISLAEERTRTYWNRKVVITSTPTTRHGLIWRNYESSNQLNYYVPCPHCNHSQVLEFAQVKWPESEREPSRIRQERLAWYECEACSGRITDLDKTRMLENGEWKSITPEKENSTHLGFRIHALYSPWLTFSEVAAKFLEAKSGGPAALMNFVNSYLAWIWEEKSEKVDTDDLEVRVKEYTRGTVPDGAVVLTAGVDVQGGDQPYLYYTIRAWGAHEESWLIEAGRLESGLEQLVPVILNRVFPGVDRQFRVTMTFIDSGYRTNEVYAFCRKHYERVRPIKGQQRISGVPLRATKIDRDSTGDTIRHSVRLFHIDTSYFKDKVTRLMTAQDGEPGAWHLHSDVPPEYLRQVTSEHKILTRNRRTGAVKSEWTQKPGGAQNHWWDTEIYATAAAHHLAVYTITEKPEPPEPRETKTHSSQQEQTPWINRRQSGGWING